ncbi:hypothetical protein FQN60_016502, partial [Etheostoma spectabile]
MTHQNAAEDPSRVQCSRQAGTSRWARRRSRKRIRAAAIPETARGEHRAARELECARPTGGLTAVRVVLVLGSSFTMNATCHIAPRIPGNYSSNRKRQRYLICNPAG